VQELMSDGVDVNLPRNDGSSALTVASEKGHDGCVKLLVQLGAKVNACNNKGSHRVTLKLHGF